MNSTCRGGKYVISFSQPLLEMDNRSIDMSSHHHVNLSVVCEPNPAVHVQEWEADLWVKPWAVLAKPKPQACSFKSSISDLV